MKKIQLSIPQPCHENWDAMTPTQQGRFCNACAKEVIDFSAMSDSEVLQYFNRKQSENVCGRVWPDQLNRAIVALPERRKPWVLQYAAAALLLLFRPGNTYAQGGIKLPHPIGEARSAAPVQKNKPLSLKKISGVVQNEKGEAVPYASVRVVHSETGCNTDSAGTFELNAVPHNALIEFSSVNFETRMMTAEAASVSPIILKDTSVILKEVVVTSAGYIRCTRQVGGMVRTKYKRTLIKRMNDSLTSFFVTIAPTIKVYPNPAARNSSFTISFNAKNPGVYALQLADASGKAVLHQVVNVTGTKHQLQIPVSTTWSAGIYFVQLVDAKGKRIAMEKLVLQ